MPARQTFRVYLAGPISRCNDAQMRRWRETVKGKYGSKMTFLDPVERLVDPEASPYEFVEVDLQHIMEADGLLVNMWRESIGAAMGVAHAHRHDRAIVVSDPNHLENKLLTFFADAVEETPLRGAKVLWNLLRAERSWRVVKSGGRTEERFERGKIMEAVRAACREAKRDDIVIPRLVLPRVIEQLRGSDRSVKKSVTTTDIDKAIADVLNLLDSNAVHADAVAGVSNAWRRRGNSLARAGKQTPTERDADHRPRVRFRSRAAARLTRRSGAGPSAALRTFHRPTRGASSEISHLFRASRESRLASSATRVHGADVKRGWECPGRPASLRGNCTTKDPRGRCNPFGCGSSRTRTSRRWRQTSSGCSVVRAPGPEKRRRVRQAQDAPAPVPWCTTRDLGQ